MSRADLEQPRDNCWLWRGDRSPRGYGVIYGYDSRYGQQRFWIHRLSFEFFKGFIPRGLLVMHDCDTPGCFNPNHLFLGTHGDNSQDMARKGRARNGKPPKRDERMESAYSLERAYIKPPRPKP